MSAPHILVVGAGPGGAALAQILASRGVRTTLVERQSDFEREFRGEVMMPGGLRVLHEMGLGDAVERLPHQRPEGFVLYRRGRRVLEVDLAALGTGGPTIVSQPHLLEMLVDEASRHAELTWVRGGLVRELLRERGRVCGVRMETREGGRELAADLVVGADGRGSVVRRRGEFGVHAIGTAMDVVWCKLPWPEALPETWRVRIYLGGGHLLLAFRAPDGLLQLAWVILKGSYGELRSRGIQAWVRAMADHVSPDLAAHLRANVERISRPFLLDARTERVRGWARPGMLLIGDAAHTMSPVGAQGINVALRDAAVAANHLVRAVRAGGGAKALDAAAARVEAERGAEIDRIQRLAALPPRVVMRRGFGAEALRASILGLARTPLARIAAPRLGRVFLEGEAPAALEV